MTQDIRAKAQADWSARADEIHSPDTIAGIQIGYDRAISIVRDAVAAERERCARIAEEIQETADCPGECQKIAEIIRGEHEPTESEQGLIPIPDGYAEQ